MFFLTYCTTVHNMNLNQPHINVQPLSQKTAHLKKAKPSQGQSSIYFVKETQKASLPSTLKVRTSNSPSISQAFSQRSLQGLFPQPHHEPPCTFKIQLLVLSKWKHLRTNLHLEFKPKYERFLYLLLASLPTVPLSVKIRYSSAGTQEVAHSLTVCIWSFLLRSRAGTEHFSIDGEPRTIRSVSSKDQCRIIESQQRSHLEAISQSVCPRG